MAISLFALWYAKRQAEAVEHANLLAAEANEQVKASQRAAAFRWEVIRDTRTVFRLVNTGWADAHDVRIGLPDHMEGRRLTGIPKTMPPHSHLSFYCEMKREGTTGGIAGPIGIFWEDRTGETPVQRTLWTSLPLPPEPDQPPWDGIFR